MSQEQYEEVHEATKHLEPDEHAHLFAVEPKPIMQHLAEVRNHTRPTQYVETEILISVDGNDEERARFLLDVLNIGELVALEDTCTRTQLLVAAAIRRKRAAAQQDGSV